MGLEDDVQRARGERVAAEQLREAWAISPLHSGGPVVQTPAADIAAVLHEALPMLGRSLESCPIFVGVGPDGITRVASSTVQRKGGFWKSDWPGSNQVALILTVHPHVGKDDPERLDLIILDEGRIAWSTGGAGHRESRQGVSAEEVRAAVIKALA